VEDIAEPLDGIEELLLADGYDVTFARDAREAITRARHKHPDLILVSLAGHLRDVSVTARRIRDRGELGEGVPVVIFCIGEIAEGDEVAIGRNIHITRPDNFNQLRRFITRLLHEVPKSRMNATMVNDYRRSL
jgi:CheY-like chemotaxis protein